MLIVCPSCASEYTLDAAHVGAEGRTVRCAACRTTWRVTAVAEEAEEAPADEAVAEAPEPALAAAAETGRPAKARTARARTGPRAPRQVPKRALAAAALLVLVGGALAGREAVVRRLPQAARLYAAIGLPVNLRGLALAEVTAYQTPGAEGGVLVVEGDVVNPTRRGVAVPGILVEVRDERDVPVYRWTAEAPRESLEPAESARFRARLAAPPAEGRRVLVRFAAAPAADH
jgi:predicted Zn finger-like uncharacterized protein